MGHQNTVIYPEILCLCTSLFLHSSPVCIGEMDQHFI